MTTRSASPDAIRFFLDDYWDNVLYNGHQPPCSADALSCYWDDFINLSASCDRPVPADLTPDLYHDIWSEEYNRHAAEEVRS